MPTGGWRTSATDRRLSDLVSMGLLTKVFPAEVVDAVIAEHGRTERRRRSLPARTVAYVAMGLALHPQGSYEDVLGLVREALTWAEHAHDRDRATTRPAGRAAISHARDRLGPEPLATLFDRVAVPLARPDTPGAWLAGRRVVAIDEACLDLPDTAANESFFGRPECTSGEHPPLPEVRMMALAEGGTRAILGAVAGPSGTSRRELSVTLLARLRPGMLCLAGPDLYSGPAWQQAIDTGADLLWGLGANLAPEPVAELSDGSWLTHLDDLQDDRRRPPTVRMIEYDGADGTEPGGPVRLVTSILDDRLVPAGELTAAYARRWELDAALGELNLRRPRSRAMLRSKTHPLVMQEIWGLMCFHYAVRALMFRADSRPR